MSSNCALKGRTRRGEHILPFAFSVDEMERDVTDVTGVLS